MIRIEHEGNVLMLYKCKLNGLTLREKIGQTVIARQNVIIQRNDLLDYIQRNPYGGIYTMTVSNKKLDAENLADEKSGYVSCSYDYRKWYKKLNNNLKIPLLAGVDAETGSKAKFNDLSATCNATEIGATNMPELAFEHGACVARELKSAGINWWWSPVVDLASRFNAVNIGRSFSDDIELSIKMACAQIKGIQSQGVAATVKHFPGPGTREYRDSHVTQTVNVTPFDEWENAQGKIFKAAVDAGVYSVMAGHAAFPAVDNTKINGNYIPATLSYEIITGLLKGKMGFNGVVVTDSLAMNSICTVYPHEKLYIELLKAGNDVILGPTKLDYIDAVERAVLAGELPEERINDACIRILNLKEKLGLFFGEDSKEYEVNDEIICKTGEMNRKVAENSVTLICDKNSRLPFKSSKVKNVAIICSTHDETVFDELQVMKGEFKKRNANVILQRRLKSKDECEKLALENDLIIYAAFLAPHRPMGASSFYGEEFMTFNHALAYGKEKSIGISFGSLYIYYDFLANADIFINAYWYNRETQKAVVAAIYGEIPFRGISPFKLSLQF